MCPIYAERIQAGPTELENILDILILLGLREYTQKEYQIRLDLIKRCCTQNEYYIWDPNGNWEAVIWEVDCNGIFRLDLTLNPSSNDIFKQCFAELQQALASTVIRQVM